MKKTSVGENNKEPIINSNAEETIRTSEAELHLMFESLTMGVVVSDINGKIVQVNEAKVRMHGYDSKEEITGRSLLDLIAASGRFRVEDNMKDRVAGGLIKSAEYSLLKKDGTEFLAEVNNAVLRDHAGNPIGFIGISQDITKRKRMEDALKQSEEKLRLMFESMTDGVTITNLEGTILEANEAKVRMHGYSNKAELIGRPVFSLSVDKDRSRIEQDRHQTFKEGYAKNIECTFLTKDRREFPGEVSIAAFKDASGNPVGTVSITRDISERRQIEEQLIITDRLASIGELSSGIAHELNNPLTSIIGFSQLLLEKDVPDNLKEDLTTINKEAQRTAQIVRNLLTFARKHEPKKQPVDINDTIQKVLEMRAYEHKINNIKVNTRFLAELPEVKADGFQLQQVFLNIIINAEYFMIEAHGRGTLDITTEHVGNIVRASFADDGPGISVESMSRIFNPFFTTKEVGKGTGLGLSICHGIVTAHGGKIYTESEPCKGATFIVELPARD